MRLKPDYVPWSCWFRWLFLSREEKRDLDELIGVYRVLVPILRNNPGAITKIRQRRSCSWGLSEEDATEAKSAVADLLAACVSFERKGVD